MIAIKVKKNNKNQYNYTYIYYLSTSIKQREVANFVKGSNLLLSPIAKLVILCTDYYLSVIYEITAPVSWKT